MILLGILVTLSGASITVLGFTVPCDQPVVVCPNTTVEFNCSVQSSVLTWIVPADINSNDESELMLQVKFSTPDPVTTGIYTASLIEGKQEGDIFHVSSVLSFMTPIDSTNSNKDIVCAVGSDDSGPSCSFSIAGIPSSPINPSVIGISIDTVNVSWSTPTNGNSCINQYTVTIISNGTSMYVVANTTHLIYNGLIQGSTYSFTVQAVDYGGRVGDTSESVTLLLDVPGKIQKLTYFVSTVMDPYSVNVNWSESISTKPPVTHYNIYDNISLSAITESFDTSVAFHNVSCDTLYLVTVNGENVVGEGGNTSISIYIQCTTSPTITSTSTGTVTSISDSAYTTNNNDVFTTASTVSATQVVTSLVKTSSTVSHSTNRSETSSTTIPIQTSPSNVVIVSVGVVCSIILVMISIFITITGVVLWSRRKKAKVSSKNNNSYEEKFELTTTNEPAPPPIPPYNPAPSAPISSEYSYASIQLDRPRGQKQKNRHSQVDDTNQYSCLQRDKIQMIGELMPVTSEYSHIKLDNDKRSGQSLPAPPVVDNTTLYSTVQKDRPRQKNGPQSNPIPVDTEYSTLQRDKVPVTGQRLPTVDYSHIQLEDKKNLTNITYAELGEFQKEKMPFPPLPLTSVVYASISKQQRLSIQNTKKTLQTGTSDAPPPVPKKTTVKTEDTPPPIPKRIT